MEIDWVWDGGRPSIDLLNTVRHRMRGGRETWRFPSELAAWLHAAGLTEGHVTATGADLVAARELRTAIDTAAFAAAEGRPIPSGSIEVINAAAAARVVPRLGTDDHGGPVLAPPDPAAAVGDALARVAADAIDLLTGAELTQLRVCSADSCGLRFVDRSPSGNRLWCSMRRCGNREKARQHYARRRQGAT